MTEAASKAESLKRPRAEEEEEDSKIPFGSSMAALSEASCLRFDGRSGVFVGRVKGSKAVVSLSQKAAFADGEGLLAVLPSLALTLTNHSGHEYSYYEAVAGKDGSSSSSFALEVIWPAQQWQIDRKKPGEYFMVEETREVYEEFVEPFAKERAAKDSAGWIDAVASLEKERDRNLFGNDDFIINVDTKWTTHAALSEDPAVRAQWKASPWTRDLYLLTIAKDPLLRSIRDLRGRHLPMLEAMDAELKKAAQSVYGVSPAKLRLFFHYKPQFYRLHAHATRCEQVNPGCEAERAHLLTTVIANLKRDSDYYQNLTILCKIGTKDALYKALVKAPDDKDKNDHGLPKALANQQI